MRVQNLTTKATCDLQFTACGWSSRGRYEGNGFVKDNNEKEKLRMYGHWNKDLKCSKVSDDETPTWEKKLWQDEESEIKVAHEHPYGFNSFAVKSIGAETAPADGKLLKSDSRLRPDRRALEKADNSTASTQKTALEERQRAERRERRARRGQRTEAERACAVLRAGQSPSVLSLNHHAAPMLQHLQLSAAE